MNGKTSKLISTYCSASGYTNPRVVKKIKEFYKNLDLKKREEFKRSMIFSVENFKKSVIKASEELPSEKEDQSN